MESNIREWRRCYDAVHRMGNILKDSYPSRDERGSFIPPKSPLSRDMQIKIEKGIERHLRKSSLILNASGLLPHKSLWIYDRNDKKTWASHNSFIYDHLFRKD